MRKTGCEWMVRMVLCLVVSARKLVGWVLNMEGEGMLELPDSP